MLYEDGNIAKDEIEVSGILNNFYINIIKHITGKERDGLDLNDLADFQSNEQILEQIKEKYSTHPGIKRIISQMTPRRLVLEKLPQLKLRKSSKP